MKYAPPGSWDKVSVFKFSLDILAGIPCRGSGGKRKD